VAHTPANARALAARVVVEVCDDGRFLDDALAAAATRAPAGTAPLVQELVYGTLRWYQQLAAIAQLWLHRPLRSKDHDVHALLLLGLYQLRALRVAPHAAVKETVEAAAALGKPWAKDLLNACLRGYLREPQRAEAAIRDDPALRLSHPPWLLEELKHAYPENWESIAQANNARPPMGLRVNLARTTRTVYLAALAAARIGARASALCESAVLLDEPRPVAELPGFAQGLASVQDVAAQFAAGLLDAQPGERVLDACAAPGGKTTHVLERTPGLAELVAVDRDGGRVHLIRENLERLGLRARLALADASRPDAWWDGRPFDRILLDAPCSATGVIRRHPDIKLRRKPPEIEQLTRAQAQLLAGLWPLLRGGGKLLYVTCSVLPRENEAQIATFLAEHADASVCAASLPVGRARRVGWQILPGEQDLDGFYYVCLAKH
jgi:16S rRNA (cytosine967-C5)-methyltransferase